MRVRRISELIELMQPAAIELVGDDADVGPDVVIDNRDATPGALFIALPGERVDGHSFAPAAVAAGAAGVVGMHLTDADVPHILAADSVDALSWLARGVVAEARARGMLSIGITGSSGKTSTKDLMAQVFEAVGPTVAPKGSQNNEIGVPLTACRVADDTAYLVSEMGSRGVGHIAWLTSLIGLDIGVCLNIGRAHVGEFGDMETTAEAKSEIVAAVGEHGWAVLNADDALVAGMADATRARIAWFGEHEPVGGDLRVTARDVVLNPLSQASFTLVVSDGEGERTAAVKLGVIGRHQVANALAAAAAALAAGLDLGLVAEALSGATSRSRWRMELTRSPGGVLVLNDAYNANPDSMSAGLRTAVELAIGSRIEHPDARVIAVLGDMLELGSASAQLHREVGVLAAELGVDEVVAVGSFADEIVAGATSSGHAARAANRDEVASSLSLGPGDVVLIKGSRGVGLEIVAAELVARDGETS
ncbi:UDP-N-acetylmuramoyl-tripeptide--D-alanyl-D-alanine ligase [Tessaracoccus bendigoensis DSM 12906]|uniref:UDP-N-acetylmuramoyl-tripeptide--D-alanyl-D-alanine ligase n=1 Tax=Tessaracoccus bendigoensis DSM 12906 TaxID=1123357 RepID=A0A1M6AQJ8_9ACTN|nr:UDP-N-acetylmuramoyl-tripeptide--D-alanyl-D-alanine ligase [Tessaracoccus bendigoensis]SHI38677.1 UDP-N-acetylmuramoyl-tripeptide--D-alanyl-D-alanine ligase [Tessaracoccus bendigoensis DSM 12906]